MNLRDFLLGVVVGGVAPLLWLLLGRRASGLKNVGIPLDVGEGHAAEVDRRIAYGEYEEAANYVLSVLKAEPGNVDLKLKLLEVYFMQGNAPAFSAAARSHAVALRAPEIWPKVLIMAKQVCPDDAMLR